MVCKVGASVGEVTVNGALQRSALSDLLQLYTFWSRRLKACQVPGRETFGIHSAVWRAQDCSIMAGAKWRREVRQGGECEKTLYKLLAHSQRFTGGKYGIVQLSYCFQKVGITLMARHVQSLITDATFEPGINTDLCT